MFGNGRGVCGEKIGRNLNFVIRIILQMGEKNWTRQMRFTVFCAAARSPLVSGTCAAPFATGTTTGSGISGFGWRCAHYSDL